MVVRVEYDSSIEGKPVLVDTYNPGIVAKTPQYSDVQAAVTAAVSGSTVRVPAGVAVWPTQVQCRKAIHLIGAGKGATLISTSANTPNNHGMVEYLPDAGEINKPFEMGGFGLDAKNMNGCFLCTAPAGGMPVTALKIHDNKMSNARSRAIVLTGLEFGAFWGNDMVDNYIHISVIGCEGLGWDMTRVPLTPANFPFFEDNVFSETTPHGGFIMELGRGGRAVFRNSIIKNYGGNTGEVWDAHGVNKVYPVDNGTVACEIYNNQVGVTVTNMRQLFHRGGRMVCANNVVTAGKAFNMMTEYQGWSYQTPAPYPKPQQVNNSMYWNNGAGNPVLYATSGYPQLDTTFIKQNRDYWLATTTGREDARPSVPVVGQTYGSTDTTRFWICNTPGQWTLMYEPYTYPHPLRAA